ncbi:hypothetical protein M513_05607 [Trichuris suis]|uniref:Uncharacterized protein n=1 Tax=Trichuris suis TaxID=68888 RepID=A0A085M8F5_9BILA|nr:hypothetical protein M513_05607 [Trichuris suis]
MEELVQSKHLIGQNCFTKSCSAVGYVPFIPAVETLRINKTGSSSIVPPQNTQMITIKSKQPHVSRKDKIFQHRTWEEEDQSTSKTEKDNFVIVNESASYTAHLLYLRTDISTPSYPQHFLDYENDIDLTCLCITPSEISQKCVYNLLTVYHFPICVGKLREA